MFFKDICGAGSSFCIQLPGYYYFCVYYPDGEWLLGVLLKTTIFNGPSYVPFPPWVS